MNAPRTLGRYQIVQEIGRGAMGVVYLAHDPRIDRRVAIKTIHMTGALPAVEAEEMRQRFFREAQAAGKLQHPGIVTIFDVGEHQGVWFIAMEYIEGRTLDTFTSKESLLTVDGVVQLMVQACDALDYAHQQRIVHRDIKPANLMLLNTGRLKITDFGLAKNPTHHLTQEAVVIGTPNYMSPEQILGRALDGRSDLFSLAAVMYELLTGQKPFSGDTITTVMYRIVHEVPPVPHMINARIPAPVGRVLSRALEKDPTQRFQSGQEMALALQGRAVASAVATMTATAGGTAAGRRPRGAHPPARAEEMLAGEDWETNKIRAVHPPRREAATGQRARSAARPGRLFFRSLLVGFAVLALILVMPRSAPNEDRWGMTSDGAQPFYRTAQIVAGGPAAPAPGPPKPGPQSSAPSSAAPGAQATPLPALESGAVKFTTDPPGGRVYLDDVEVQGGVAYLPHEDNATHTVVAENDCSIEKVTYRRSQGDAVTIQMKTPKVSIVPVASTPAGAGITLNGKVSGLKTPAEVPVPVCGDHTLALQLEGYQDVQAKIGGPEPDPVRLTLAPIPAGFVILKTPYQVSVLLKGKKVGTSGGKIKLPAGKHTLTLRNEDLFVDRPLTVTIAADKTITPPAGLPAVGAITVLASPSNCLIYVNGRELGAPPINDHQLAAGSYQVRAVYVPTGEMKETTVAVTGGGNARVPFKFKP